MSSLRRASELDQLEVVGRFKQGERRRAVRIWLASGAFQRHAWTRCRRKQLMALGGDRELGAEKLPSARTRSFSGGEGTTCPPPLGAGPALYGRPTRRRLGREGLRRLSAQAQRRIRQQPVLPTELVRAARAGCVANRLGCRCGRSVIPDAASKRRSCRPADHPAETWAPAQGTSALQDRLGGIACSTPVSEVRVADPGA